MSRRPYRAWLDDRWRTHLVATALLGGAAVAVIPVDLAGAVVLYAVATVVARCALYPWYLAETRREVRSE
jgi:Flp pilus assembly protein TadB